MTRSGGDGVEAEVEEEIWGTWEELVLACAVNRHGTQSWESVALEVGSRTPSSHLLTARSCEQRYYDLRCRFESDGHGIDDGGEFPGGCSPVAVPWVAELRKLRVAELRREVERYDVSIMSLHLKVKKLEEERERSLPAEETGIGNPDLDECSNQHHGEPPVSTPERLTAGLLAIGERSGHSCNETNTTGAKDDRKTVEVAKPDEKKTDPVSGSSDTITKGELGAAAPQHESMAESKGETARESSDIQSSVSLSRGRRRGLRNATGKSSSSGEEPAVDRRSQPLAAILEKIRSNNYGSFFQRRLDCQDSARYRSMIRQHIDLESVESKLGGGAYTNDVEFFRDLLLLCNNAIVFFQNNSDEYVAAVHLRKLGIKEIKATNRKLNSSPSLEPPPFPQPSSSLEAKCEQVLASSLLERSSSMATLAPCRKRSSISARAAAVVVAESKEEETELEKKPVTMEKKADMEKKPESVEKKKTRERPMVRGLRTTKARGAAIKISTTGTKSSTPVEKTVEMIKPETKNNDTASTPLSAAKKQGAAGFLKRMNRSSSSPSSGTLMETLKTTSIGSSKAGGKKRRGGKGDGQKDHGSRQAHTKKKQEKGAVPVKRGRPPKRRLPPPMQRLAKRARVVEAEVAPPTPRRATKKGRR